MARVKQPSLHCARSRDLFRVARELLPGGVDSPVRAFQSVGGHPLFIDRGEGPYIIDVDGNSYVDYVLSWGPLILGHACPAVVDSIRQAAAQGTSFGACSPLEIELARLVQSFMPGLEMMRFVNSGTEATMSALRLARAFTEREKVIKFEGNYHGHSDMMLVKGGSGMATLAQPDSPGVTEGTARDTLVAAYNDSESVAELLDRNPGQVAAVIVEPVAANMNLVLPQGDFLAQLRELTKTHGALLIFDEVLTGFRVGSSGAQGLYGVQPDLTTLGKVIGGGLPVGAYGGRREIMEMVAPSGPVYQAGTLSGNPLAMTAGIATLKELRRLDPWRTLEQLNSNFAQQLQSAADAAQVPVKVGRIGSLFGIFFGQETPIDWTSASRTSREVYSDFFWELLGQGVYLAPSPFEVGFISTAHTPEILEATIEKAYQGLKSLRNRQLM